MAARVIWLAGWTLLLAVVLALVAVVALGFTTVREPVESGPGGPGVTEVACRPFDVMLGRETGTGTATDTETGCDGWPTGRAMPMLLVLAAIAAWGVPERRRGTPAVRIVGCLATVVSAVLVLVTVGNLDFTPRATTMRLLWAVLLCGLAPLVLLPAAVRRDRTRAGPGNSGGPGSAGSVSGAISR